MYIKKLRFFGDLFSFLFFSHFKFPLRFNFMSPRFLTTWVFLQVSPNIFLNYPLHYCICPNISHTFFPKLMGLEIMVRLIFATEGTARLHAVIAVRVLLYTDINKVITPYSK